MTPEEPAREVLYKRPLSFGRGRDYAPWQLCEVLKPLEPLIAAAIRQAILEEREACAKVCDERERIGKEIGNGYANGCADCAQQIRERK